ncbi:unnamed protein product [Oncorhynchus mykiss]|uniref:Family with sequence similarity 222 member Bb n=1 Tax=Oncorhynchus mykiss TaxID=8022 RepID=A0A060WS52_ONCMY|nr:unnamed protein product [Oncorhynchus mykiss]
MLACLPASSGEPTPRFLSHTQMNTGLQQWDTTQKMKSANYPTPAELDAFAKKVANNPLTIKIFPNSVKVPQRKHIRRTVNGLDTSSSSQRQSSYPSQVSSTRAGLLAVLRTSPGKGVLTDTDSSRAHLLPKPSMNLHSGPYVAQSTLNLPQPPQALAQKQGHPQHAVQHNMAHPMTSQPPNMPQTLQQQNMAHPQTLQLQQSLSQLQTVQQNLAHPQNVQRQQSLPHTQTLQQQQQQQQHILHPPTLQHQTLPHQQALLQQARAQGLRHLPDQPSLQHSQGLPPSQPLPQASSAGPGSPSASIALQPQPGPPYGPRKLPDADAPPNVTVSTSTIPLSMAAGLHHNRPGTDLSSIVHQINQFCQARAGLGATSVCEGQIANPSPISRNLLINASSRVNTPHNFGLLPSSLLGHTEKAPGGSQGPAVTAAAITAAAITAAAITTGSPASTSVTAAPTGSPAAATTSSLAHMQHLPDGAQPCKNPRREAPSGPGFPAKTHNYPQKLLAPQPQSFPIKHPSDKTTPSPPVTGPAGGTMPSYTNGRYLQVPWGSVLQAAKSDGLGPQDLPMAFQGGPAGASIDCSTPGSQYRPGARPGVPDLGQTKLMQQNVSDYLSGDFQAFQQNPGAMGKMHRPPMSRAPAQSPELGNSRNIHAHHPGYR